MIKAELIDYCGDDLRVVNAARVSFDKHSDNMTGQDERLISYLAKHNHFTPFTHCVITLRETVPIFVAAQRMKHQIGFTYNSVSRRYVDSPPDFYVPDEWRARPDASIKQGSGEPIEERYQHGIKASYEAFLRRAYQEYTALISVGVAPEQARMLLPQSTLTSYYVTGSLAAFARAYNLRAEETAQKEIQDLAQQWNDIIEPLYPCSWRALTCGH